MSKAVEEADWETRAGEKAEADDKRVAVIPTNFILSVVSGKVVLVVTRSAQD